MAGGDEERTLVARAAAGEAAAFEAIYRAHRDWVAALALRMTGDRDDALDVLQDAFVWLWRHLPATLSSTLRAYLYPAIKHRAIDLARRKKKVVALRGDEELAWDGGLDTGDFQRLVAPLSVEQREVVTLRFAAGMQLDEIAAALGVPEGTVKSRLFNALRALRPT